jgi:hypothetical protein
MAPARSLHFAAAARALAQAARAAGWAAPGFRSPPRVPGARRTLRRHAPGQATVAVLLRDRPWEAVLADMIEGVVVANGLTGVDAAACREQLWVAAVAVPAPVAPSPLPTGTRSAA